MPSQYPIVNGFAYEWARVVISANGNEYQGVVSIDYSSELMPQEARGNHPQVLSRTRGEHKAEASMEMLLKDANQFIQDLGDGFGEVIFEITVSYQGSGDIEIITDTLIGCRITKPQNSHSGTDALKRKFDLSLLEVKYSGKSIVKDSLY